MRRFTFLLSALALGSALHAQTIATFDDLTLTKADTSYINYNNAGTDVGFNDGLAHFPAYFDTSSLYGNSWASGFSYSNWTDSVTSGYTNPFSAKTAVGYNGSANYAAVACINPVTFDYNINLNLTGAAIGHPVSGFYVTNSTYAYNSMFYGDAFEAKFQSGDWFLLTVKGYSGGALTTDSVNFYLADFLFTDTAMNYIEKGWEWVNLLPLGNVDSLQFSLTSSSNGAFGMNTPAYFCIDNFTTHENSEGVSQVANTAVAKVYPNPATNMLYVNLIDNSVKQINVMDMAGHIIITYDVAGSITGINTASLPAGTYMLQLTGNGKNASMRFVKD